MIVYAVHESKCWWCRWLRCSLVAERGSTWETLMFYLLLLKTVVNPDGWFYNIVLLVWNVLLWTLFDHLIIFLKFSRALGKWSIIKCTVFNYFFYFIYKSVISWRDVTLSSENVRQMAQSAEICVNALNITNWIL